MATRIQETSLKSGKTVIYHLFTPFLSEDLGRMAYTLESLPPNVNISTTAPPEVHLTSWERVKLWFSIEQNVAQYIIIPLFFIIFGGCIIIYVCHRLRKLYRKRKRTKR